MFYKPFTDNNFVDNCLIFLSLDWLDLSLQERDINIFIDVFWVSVLSSGHDQQWTHMKYKGEKTHVIDIIAC